MLGLVSEAAVYDAANFVDGVPKLQAAVLDVNLRLAVSYETTVDIGNASGWTPGFPPRPCSRALRLRLLHALNASRPFPAGPTPRDFSLRCNAERSIPMKAAVREMLPPKRLICATR